MFFPFLKKKTDSKDKNMFVIYEGQIFWGNLQREEKLSRQGKKVLP
jgi:hypothetical protein